MTTFSISIYTTKPYQSKYSVSCRIMAKSKFQALLKFVRMLKKESANINLTKVQYIQYC